MPALQRAAIESKAEIQAALAGADMVFVTVSTLNPEAGAALGVPPGDS